MAWQMERRTLLAGLLASGALGHGRPAAAVGDGALAEAVAKGVTAFAELARVHATACEALAQAIATGDLARAKMAYLAARPPYEQIEVLAAAFPELDAAIDARAYAFAGGETNPEFRGAHRVEALLFRDGDLEAAAPWSEHLVADARDLAATLAAPLVVAPTLAFAGMITLADEVAAKKISSEEETWSDASLLVFRSNWEGIATVYAPFAEHVARADAQRDDRVQAAIAAARATLAGHFEAEPIAGTPYSRVDLETRAQVVRASLELRAALIEATAAL